MTVAVKQPVVPALLVAWAFAVAPTLLWLVRSSAGSDGRLLMLSSVLLVATGVMLRRSEGATPPTASSAPTPPTTSAPSLLPVVLLGAGLAFAVLVRRTIAFHSLEALGMGLATYGALGLVLSRAAFRRALPLALLLACVLPMGGHLETHLGFPLRAQTAELVATLLTQLGYDVATSETILLVENHAAQVDLPCSGMKSLWAGLLFFFGASVVLRVRVGVAWLATLAAFVLALVAGNALRVAALSILALVVKNPVLTETVHAPLGILAFLVAGLLAVATLRLLPAESAVAAPAVSGASRTRSPLFAAALAFFLFALVPTRTIAKVESDLGFTYRPPASLNVTPEAMSSVEARFLKDQGASYSGKWRFSTPEGLTGSFLVVVARTWRAQHPPEQCLAGAGNALAGVSTELLAADFPLRVVAFADQGARAMYWFESAESRTADYGARVFDGILAAGRGVAPAWAMISVLFDRPMHPHDGAVAAVARALSGSTAAQLKEISP